MRRAECKHYQGELAKEGENLMSFTSYHWKCFEELRLLMAKVLRVVKVTLAPVRGTVESE